MEKQLGVINEIGDLGLGFTEVSEDQLKVLQEKEKSEDLTKKEIKK